MRLLEDIILLGACSNGLGTFESQDGSPPASSQMPNFGGGPPGAPAVMGGFGGMPNFGGGPPGAPTVIGRQMPNLGGGPPGAPGIMGMSGFGGGMPTFGGGPPGSSALLSSFGQRRMPNLGGGPPGAPSVTGESRRMPNLGGGPPGAPGVMGMPQFGGGPPGAPGIMGSFGGGMPTFGGGPPGAAAIPGMPVPHGHDHGHDHSHLMSDTVISEGLPSEFPKSGLPPLEPEKPAPGSLIEEPSIPLSRPGIPGLQAFGVAPPLPPGITMPPLGQSMRGFQMPQRQNSMPMAKPPVPPPPPVNNLPEAITGTPDGWTPTNGVESPPLPVTDLISIPNTSLFNVNPPVKKPELPEIPVHKESLAIAAALKPKVPGDIKPEVTHEIPIDELKSNQNESILSQLKTKYSGTPPPPTPPSRTTEDPTTITMSNFEPYEDYQYENSNEVVGKLEEVVQIKQAESAEMEHKATNHRLHGITTDAEHHEHGDEHSHEHPHEHPHDHNDDNVSQMTETEVEHKLIANITEPIEEPEPEPGSESNVSSANHISSSIATVIFSVALLNL